MDTFLPFDWLKCHDFFVIGARAGFPACGGASGVLTASDLSSVAVFAIF